MVLNERASVVIISEFKIRNYSLLEKEISPYMSLKSPTIVKEESVCKKITEKECRIKNVLIASLKQCDKNKTYCILMEDDITLAQFWQYSLFYMIVPWNNDNSYVMDCAKVGLFKKNYKVNGNGLHCRIVSKFKIEYLVDCLNQTDKPADIAYESCLKGSEEKRFLMAINTNKISLRY